MITMWKNNRLDQAWSISTDELAERFMNSIEAQHVRQGAYRLEPAIRLFITGNQGLSSVFEERDMPEIYEACKSALWPHAL